MILKDQEARDRYDKEYYYFNLHQQAANAKADDKYNGETAGGGRSESKQGDEFDDYTVRDEVLKTWMENARKQAVDLAKKTIEEFKDISTAGGKAVAAEAASGIGRYLIYSIVMFAIFAIIRGCN